VVVRAYKRIDQGGRSHPFQTHHQYDPHEDWVDGSWTVDYVCDVNFDDGEEMLNRGNYNNNDDDSEETFG